MRHPFQKCLSEDIHFKNAYLRIHILRMCFRLVFLAICMRSGVPVKKVVKNGSFVHHHWLSCLHIIRKNGKYRTQTLISADWQYQSMFTHWDLTKTPINLTFYFILNFLL